MATNINQKLDKLQELVIDQLIKELEEGISDNISVANTLLTANKVVIKHDEGDSTHAKVKKIMKREKE